MDKRIVKIEEIKDNEVFVSIFLEEIKKIQEIPKMPKCEFLHIGATSTTQVLGEKIVDILVVVENLYLSISIPLFKIQYGLSPKSQSPASLLQAIASL